MLPENLFQEDEIDQGPPPPEMPADDPAYDLAERYAEQLLLKRQLMREVKNVEKELNRLEPFLLNFFERHPAHHKFSVHNMSIFQQTERWARPKDGYSKQDLCDALRASGEDWAIFIRDDVSVKKLTEHIEEIEMNHVEELESGAIPDVGALLPPRVAETVNLNPTPKIIARKQAKPKKH